MIYQSNLLLLAAGTATEQSACMKRTKTAVLSFLCSLSHCLASMEKELVEEKWSHLKSTEGDRRKKQTAAVAVQETNVQNMNKEREGGDSKQDKLGHFINICMSFHKDRLRPACWWIYCRVPFHKGQRKREGMGSLKLAMLWEKRFKLRLHIPVYLLNSTMKKLLDHNKSRIVF